MPRPPNHPQPPGFCFTCGYFFDTATATPGTNGKPPMPGDYTICLNCGALSQFTKELKVAPASMDALAQLNEHKRRVVLEAQRFIKERGPIAKKERPT